jgi:hypothetical protein
MTSLKPGIGTSIPCLSRSFPESFPLIGRNLDSVEEGCEELALMGPGQSQAFPVRNLL